ncbi:MAG: hypothetical protein WKF58_03660 [Ilumatobacteraceae bacterium]
MIVPQGEAIVPPATIGMLGGGQLGRYTLIAARQMGYGTAVLDPDPHAPAGAIADVHLVAPYDDASALDELAATCAVVTTEFENPPAASLRRLAERLHVAPSPAAVAVAQDRRGRRRSCATTRSRSVRSRSSRVRTTTTTSTARAARSRSLRS